MNSLLSSFIEDGVFKKEFFLLTGGSILFLIVVAAVIGPYIIPYTYDQQDFNQLNIPPCLQHWFGTDELGRDILVRCLIGGRISILIALISTTISIVIGTSYGAIAGYLGGWIDEILMRIVDVLYAVPFIFVSIVLMSFFGRNIYLLFALLGGLSWMTLARIVRGQVLTLKNQAFIEAAISIGASRTRIIFHHLIPNTLSVIITYSVLIVPSLVLDESFLSFLGMGIQPPLSSWGTMINAGVQSISVYPWQLFFPSLIMVLMVIGLNLFGEGLRKINTHS